MFEILGWIGAICFALCAIPQAVDCYRAKHADGLNSAFLAVWLGGELFTMAAVLGKWGWIGWLMFNLTANTSCLLVIIRYKLFPRRV